MTFSVVMSTPAAIWACADRQIVYDDGTPLPPPTAVKISIIQGVDGVALLAYAGLGIKNRTEVSQWVAQALRGVSGSLGPMFHRLGSATKRNIEPKWHHSFIAATAGLGQWRGHRNAIELVKPGKMGVYFPRTGRETFILQAGSGAQFLKHESNRLKTLRVVASRHAEGKASAKTVVEQLVALNIAVSEHADGPKGGVSKECVCLYWLNDNSKAEHWAFDAAGRVAQVPYIIPYIAQGFVFSDLARGLIPYIVGPNQMLPAEHVLRLFNYAASPGDERFH